ncbi:MAG: hypothetical protein JWN92_3035 [Candidatus Acidoferrum typicum]|nr:hypothetical protein [Candidatus Acidoferrum typicum]
MWNHIEQEVRVANYFEIETPVRANATLPDILGLVEFLGSQRCMTNVMYQECDLFVELFLNT